MWFCNKGDGENRGLGGEVLDGPNGVPQGFSLFFCNKSALLGVL